MESCEQWTPIVAFWRSCLSYWWKALLVVIILVRTRNIIKPKKMHADKPPHDYFPWGSYFYSFFSPLLSWSRSHTRVSEWLNERVPKGHIYFHLFLLLCLYRQPREDRNCWKKDWRKNLIVSRKIFSNFSIEHHIIDDAQICIFFT